MRAVLAAVRFISAEPLLDDGSDLDLSGIRWVNDGFFGSDLLLVGCMLGRRVGSHSVRHPLRPQTASIRARVAALGVSLIHQLRRSGCMTISATPN